MVVGLDGGIGNVKIIIYFKGKTCRTDRSEVRGRNQDHSQVSGLKKNKWMVVSFLGKTDGKINFKGEFST